MIVRDTVKVDCVCSRMHLVFAHIWGCLKKEERESLTVASVSRYCSWTLHVNMYVCLCYTDQMRQSVTGKFKQVGCLQSKIYIQHQCLQPFCQGQTNIIKRWSTSSDSVNIFRLPFGQWSWSCLRALCNALTFSRLCPLLMVSDILL